MGLYTYDGEEQDVHHVTPNSCIQDMQQVHTINIMLEQIHSVYPRILTGENTMMQVTLLPVSTVQSMSLTAIQWETLHTKYHDYDVPCAVCQSKKRFNVHMIPAKDRCFNGWHLEYRGYLMTQRYGHAASNYVCVDAKPEKIGSNSNQNGRLFYPVESICGSLPCPPYVNYRELTCAVCTF